MQYNPTPDRSAEILANASNNASQIAAQGNANLQNSLTSSFNTAMGLVSKNVETANKNKMTSDYLDGKAAQFNQTKDANGNALLSDEELEKFYKSSLGKKTGMLAPIEAQYDQTLKNSYFDSQLKLWGAKYGIQNQVPQNQQPFTATPAATSSTASQTTSGQTQPNPVGGINFNYVK